MPVFQVTGTLGALEIGTFVSILLFGVLCLQTYNYFMKFEEDRIILKLTIAFLWLLELAHTICSCYETYRTTIISFSSIAGLAGPWTALTTGILFSSLITFLVQAVFAFRIGKITHSRMLMSICILIALLGLAGGIAVSVEGIKSVSLAGFSWGWLITTYLSIVAFDDLLITVTLCWSLKKQVGGDGITVMKNTARVVDRIVVWTIETGLVTSLSAIAIVITWQTSVPTNFAWISLWITLAKVYSNSLLASLNGRETLRRLDQEKTRPGSSLRFDDLEWRARSGTGTELHANTGTDSHTQHNLDLESPSLHSATMPNTTSKKQELSSIV